MTLRWGIFFFVVAIVAALASLGVFGTAGPGETAGQVGVAKVIFLGLLAGGAAGFVGWIVFLNQKQKRGASDMPAERPWNDEDMHVHQDDAGTVDTARPQRSEPMPGSSRRGGERPSGLR